MILEPLAPSEDERLCTVARRPDESLYDYLVRARWELVGRIRLLAASRDAHHAMLTSERRRSARLLLIVALSEPLVAAFLAVAAISEGSAQEASAPLLGLLFFLATFGAGVLATASFHVVEMMGACLRCRRRP